MYVQPEAYNATCKASPTVGRRDDSTNGELSNVRVLILQPLHAITILIAPPIPSVIALTGTKYHYTLEFDIPYFDSFRQ